MANGEMSDQDLRKAVIYCRVSTKKQTEKGDGLQSQETRCREYAGYRNLEVTHSFKDAKSGFGVNRPAMQKMLKFLRQHRKDNYVVVIDDISRLARGLKAHLQLRETLTKAGAELLSPNIEFGEDADSELHEHIMATVVAHQRRKNAEQNRDRTRSRMLNGWWAVRRPPGYKYVDCPSGGRMLVRDEPLASIIADGMEKYASGQFQLKAEVARYWEQFPEFPKDYRGKVAYKEVDRYFGRIAYAGYIESDALDVSLREGRHEPLISLETFQRIQHRMKDVAYAPTRKNVDEDFPLRGFIACGDCGQPMTSCWSKGRTKRYAYYYCVTKDCKSQSKTIAKGKLEAEFGALLQRMTPSRQLVDVARQMFQDLWDNRAARHKAYQTHLKTQVFKLEREADKLIQRLVEVETPSVQKALEAKVAKLEREKLVMQEKATKKVDSKRTFNATLRTALAFLANPYELWVSERFEHKRAVLKLAFTGRLEYTRDGGFRTAQVADLFELFGNIGEKLNLAEKEGFEPSMKL